MSKLTKVTKDDLDLADEISLVTTIKSHLDEFSQVLLDEFEQLTHIATASNPVETYLSILNIQDVLLTSFHNIGAKLIETLGQMDAEDAHQLVNPDTLELAKVMSTEIVLDTEEPQLEIDTALSVFNEEKE